MKRVVAVMVVMLAACGGKSADQCRQEATEVGELLVEAAKEAPALFGIADDMPLVTRTDLAVRKDLQQAPIVTLSAAQIRHGTTLLADLDALAASLRAEHDQLLADLESGRMPRRWIEHDSRVYFAIDPQTPWERVVAAVDKATEAGLDAPAFVFAAPQPLAAPPRSPIDDKLDAIMDVDPSERAYQVAQLASKLVERCAPLEQAFSSVVSVDGKDKGMILAQAVKPALIACECKADIPELRSVMFRILFVPRPLRVVAFDPAVHQERVKLPRATAWAEASQRFKRTLRNAKLIAE
jgi:hypothetical protein